MIISRQNYRTEFFKVNDYKFERVRNFRYLYADINKDANNHEEVKSRHNQQVLLWTDSTIQV